MGRPAKRPRQKIKHQEALRRFLPIATTDVARSVDAETTADLYIAFERFCSQNRIECMKRPVFCQELAKTFEADPVREGFGGGFVMVRPQLRPSWRKVVDRANERQQDKADAKVTYPNRSLREL